MEPYTNPNEVSFSFKKIEKVIFGILFSVSFLVPLFFLPASFVSIQFGTSLLFGFGVILALLGYIILAFSRGYIEIPRPITYTLVSLLAVPLVYFFAGISNGFSRMVFLGYTFDISTVGFLILSFVYMFLLTLFFRSQNRIIYSYFAFLLSASVTALFIIFRLMIGAGFLSFGIFNDLSSTIIGSWNSVGIFFGISAILSLLTFQMSHMSKILRVFALVATVVSLFFVALIGFKTVWIVLAICVLLVLLYNIFNYESITSISIVERLKKVKILPLAVFIICLVFIFGGKGFSSYLSTSFNVPNLDVRPSLAVTLDIAKNTIKTKPLFGSGPNTFLTQWLSYKPDDVVMTEFWNTDFAYGIGLLPTFAVTTGLIGVLSWLLFFGFYITVGIKVLFLKIEDMMTKYLVTSSFFVSLFLWIMMWVYTPSVAIFILTFFFTGLFFASACMTGVLVVVQKTFSDSPKIGFISSLLLMSLFFASLALGYGLYQNSKSLWYFQKSVYAINTAGDIDASQAHMQNAIKTLPSDMYYRSLAEIELLKLNNIAAQDPKVVPVETMQKQFSDVLAASIKAGISARDMDTSNYLNWISLAKVYHSVVPYKVQGAYESAKFAYSEALRRNPKNPGIFIMLARLEADRGDLKSAREFTFQAIQMKQNYVDAYFLLSQIEVSDNNLKGAIDSVSALAVIEPNNSNVFFQLGLLKYNGKDFIGAIEALEKAISLTPDYANAKYFLGLSYEASGKHTEAIAQFTDLQKTNPDSKEVTEILNNLKAGKAIFTDSTTKPEKGAKLPVKENQN